MRGLAGFLRDQEGWSFIETVIVIGIVLVLTAAVGVSSLRFVDRARTAAARSEVATLAMALETYALDCGAAPALAEGLGALWLPPAGVAPGWNGPYLSKAPGPDPWGRAYEYLVPGEAGLPFGVRSLGADGLPGGSGAAADVVSWE